MATKKAKTSKQEQKPLTFDLFMESELINDKFSVDIFKAVLSNIFTSNVIDNKMITKEQVLRTFINLALDTDSLLIYAISCKIEVNDEDNVVTIYLDEDKTGLWNLAEMSNIMLNNSNYFIKKRFCKPPCENCIFWKPAPHYSIEKGSYVATICCIAKERMQDFSCFRQ